MSILCVFLFVRVRYTKSKIEKEEKNLILKLTIVLVSTTGQTEPWRLTVTRKVKRKKEKKSRIVQYSVTKILVQQIEHIKYSSKVIMENSTSQHSEYPGTQHPNKSRINV